MIPIRKARGSKRLKEAKDFGIVPVGRADKSAPDIALPVDYEGFWPSGGSVPRRSGLFGIPDGGEIYVALNEEAFVGILIFVDADGEDGILGMLVMKLEQ